MTKGADTPIYKNKKYNTDLTIVAWYMSTFGIVQIRRIGQYIVRTDNDIEKSTLFYRAYSINGCKNIDSRINTHPFFDGIDVSITEHKDLEGPYKEIIFSKHAGRFTLDFQVYNNPVNFTDKKNPAYWDEIKKIEQRKSYSKTKNKK